MENVATKSIKPTIICESPLRAMVFLNSTFPLSNRLVLSTACAYSVSICAACACTCVAKSDDSADISTT